MSEEENSHNEDSFNNNSNNTSTWGEWIWDWSKYFLKEAAIYTGTVLLSKFIVDLVQQSNPQLTTPQAESLYKLLNQTVSRYRRGQDVQYQLRAILALICPEDRDVESLFNAIISGEAFSSIPRETPGLTPEQREERHMPEDFEFTAMKVDDEASDALVKLYGLDEERVLLLPIPLREVLLSTLATNPTCPISMDDLVALEDDVDSGNVKGHVKKGVTALFQYTNNVPHCFLFDSETIEGWVTENNTNPVTRQVVNRKEYFVIN